MSMVLLWWCVLWPICGADDRALMVVPKEGQALFDKLQRIKVDAMADPKVFHGVVCEQDIIRVREALQKVFVGQEALPACVIESGLKPSITDTQHMAYGLYDVFAYIYGKTGTSSSKKRRFVTYAAAYQVGILPAHLKVLDTAMYTAKNIRYPYLHDASFAKAFAWLTADTYAHAVRPYLTYDDVALTLDPYHLTVLAPMVSWLEGQTARYVPTGVRDTILRYAFGTNFGAYARMCSVKEVVLQKEHTGGECLYQDKQVAWRDVKMTKRILERVWVSEHRFPYAFVERCVKQRDVFTKPLKVNATCVEAIYDCVRYCTLYDVLSHVREMSYLDFLREGWTEEHGLMMEKSLQMYKPVVFAWLEQAHPAVEIAVVLFLLGAFGTSKATVSIQYHYANGH